MIRIIRFLITGDWHLHKWETIKQVPARDELGHSYTKHYLQCQVCGKVKST